VINERIDCVGQRLGNYRLLHQLGAGAFADVYLAEHLYLNTRVAIKLLHAHPGAVSRQAFLTEARLLGQLVHPHIIRVFDFGLQDDVPYLVMDYAPHGNLRQLYPAGSRLPLSTVLAYVRAIASALQYAHDQHIIHRDLKPENLLLGPKHEVLLSDFGLALLTSPEDALQVQSRLGTLAYMASEQIRGQPSSASDQYSLAVMVYEWLCGQLPFQGSVAELTHRQLYSAPVPLWEYLPDLPPGVEQVVSQGLAKDPTQRFVDVLCFATAFEEACQVLSHLPLAVGSFTPTAPAALPSLPAPLTPLLGRAKEIRIVRDLLLHPEVHLLTLTGPPGVGKTRLALHLGAELLQAQAFRHGIYFVSLSAIRDPSLVLPTLAHALGLPTSSSLPLSEHLTTMLHDQQILLLLDDFEQVLPAALQLTALLSACPRLKLLVTSRILLHVEGEYELAVPPLALPDEQPLPAVEALSQVASVALFVQRAQAVRTEFRLTEDNAHTIAEICRRLDGLPLALELAAARIRLFPLTTLLARLEHRLEVLTGGRQDAPAHQRTLRDTLAWSYELLNREERAFLRRLSVFVDDCTLEAAEAICTAPGDIHTPALDLVASLLDHSLLHQHEQEAMLEPRLHLLEIIREYGLEELEAYGEREPCQQAHAAYYLELAEEAEPALVGPTQAVWREQLELMLENIVAALRFLLERKQTEEALRLASALRRFWLLGGYLSEGRRFLEQGLATSRGGEASVSEQVRAKALSAAGYLAFLQDSPEQAQELFAESERLHRTLGDKRSLAEALNYLGLLIHNCGEIQAATAMLDEGLLLARELDDHQVSATILQSMGVILLLRGEFTRAHALLEESLSYFEEVGHVWGSAIALYYLGWTIYSQGDATRARPLLERSVALFTTLGKSVFAVEARILLASILAAAREEGSAYTLLQEALAVELQLEGTYNLGRALYGLGLLALRTGDLAQARHLFEDSLRQFQGYWLLPRIKWVLASCLEGLGEIALAEGKATWAVRLLAAAEAVRAAHGYYSPLGRAQPFYEHALAETRARVGKEVFSTLWTQGLEMTPEQAMSAQEQERAEKDHGVMLTSPSLVASTISPSMPRASLTRREVEVLRLVAQGLTNHQIAEQLIVSPHTVNVHVQSIYGKLGVSSRAGATRYTLEHNLQ